VLLFLRLFSDILIGLTLPVFGRPVCCWQDSE
jgi:hypothetical protein